VSIVVKVPRPGAKIGAQNLAAQFGAQFFITINGRMWLWLVLYVGQQLYSRQYR